MFKTVWILLTFFNAQHKQYVKDSIRACYPINKIIFVAGLNSNTAATGIYNDYNISKTHLQDEFYSPAYTDKVTTFFSPVLGVRLRSEQNQFFGLMLGANYSIKSFAYNYKNEVSSYIPTGVLPKTYDLTSQSGSGIVSCHALSGEFFVFYKLPLEFKLYGGVVLNGIFARTYNSNISVTEKSVLTKAKGGSLYNPPPDSVVTVKSEYTIHDLKPSITPNFIGTGVLGIEKSFQFKSNEYLVGANYSISRYAMGVQFYLARAIGIKKRVKKPLPPKVEKPVETPAAPTETPEQ